MVRKSASLIALALMMLLVAGCSGGGGNALTPTEQINAQLDKWQFALETENAQAAGDILAPTYTVYGVDASVTTLTREEYVAGLAYLFATGVSFEEYLIYDRTVTIVSDTQAIVGVQERIAVVEPGNPVQHEIHDVIYAFTENNGSWLLVAKEVTNVTPL